MRKFVKSLKQLPEENEELMQEVNDDYNDANTTISTTSLNTTNSNGKKGLPKQSKTTLIDKIDSELNQIEYCDTFTDNTKQIDFEKNADYFLVYLVEKLVYAFENDQQELNLSNLNLTNDLLRDIDLAQNPSFKAAFEQLRHTNDNASSKQNAGEYLNDNITKIRVLDLSKNKLRDLPLKFIELFTNLDIVRCNENYFDSIKLQINRANINFYQQLRTLDLSSNLIRSFEIDFNKNLTEDSQYEQIEKIYLKLENLNLSNNKLTIREIDSCNFLLKLINLKFLNLSGNNFTTLPWQIINLYNLNELNFSNNLNLNLCDISVLRESVAIDHAKADDQTKAHIDELFINNFSNLKNLKILDLSGNNLNNLPNDIRQLSKLEVLFLDKNNLEFIPTQIQELTHLRVLSINENRLQEISKNFCLHAKFKKNLIIFNLRKNNLNNENFTEFFFIFQNLLKLDLSENQFRQMPNALPESIEELKINTNKINTLNIRAPFADGLGLNLNDNEFDDVKQWEFVKERYQSNEAIANTGLNVFYLRNLRRLHLRKNNLKEIPADFGLLNTSLEYLDLSMNLISQFDSSLCRGFTCLKYLNLNSNYIRYVPEQVRELQHLRYLNLSKNQIFRLNFEICNELANLTELDLHNNNLEELPVFKREAKQANANANLLVAAGISQQATNELIREAMAKQNLFTFDLKNLQRVDLSSNRFHSTFSVFNAFALCSNLKEMNLDSNLIAHIEFDRSDEEEQQLQLQQQQQQQQADKDIKNKKNVTVKSPRKGDTTQLGGTLPQTQQPAQKTDQPQPILTNRNAAAANKKYTLTQLEYINLSNNRIEFAKGGFTRMLLSLYKLAPNLNRFVYNQLNGSKLGGPTGNGSSSNRDSNYYFDYFQNETDEKSNAQFQLLSKNLRILDLSNNNLNKIPMILRKMQDLKEIYLNGNAIQKLPRDLLHINKTITSVQNEGTQKQLPAINENIEILQLNDNKLEQIPENLFMHFKNLKQIQVHNNPLREPPKGAMCAAFDDSKNELEDFKEIWNQNVMEFFQDQSQNPIVDLVDVTSDDRMKPIRSYMLKYKKREEMLLCNMFVIIKDEIDSQETLFKLMRRLRMPMDKVELVCKEIEEYVKANWRRNVDKTKLRMKKADMHKLIKDQVLKTQTWKLLNIWRQVYGTDAHSDELIRIFQLMNSNQYEDALLSKLHSLKYISSVLKI